MDKVYISVVETEYEVWNILANDHAVVRIELSKYGDIPNENEISSLAANQLREYLVNIRKEFDFPIDPAGTPFQKEVWNVLRQIPYGQTASYGEIAAQIGRPRAVRAVGQAIGRNPCLVAIPCHRVLGKDGSLTGFSAGMELKRRLLRLENIPYRE